MSYQEISCSTVKGRKDYDCEWCDEKILKGESQVSRVYKFEGELVSGRMHPECFEAMGKSSHEISDGWQSGEPERGVAL